MTSRAGDGSTVYDIELEYQIFNNPDEVTEVTTPQILLNLRADERTVTKAIPAWTFTLSPVLEARAASGEGAWGLQPDLPPAPLPTGIWKTLFALSLAAFAAAALWTAGEFWGFPVLLGRQRPFARAYRQVRGLSGEPVTRDRYENGLRAVHRAFNETCGRTVFAADLPVLRASQGESGLLGPDLVSEFESLTDLSDREFFSGGSTDTVTGADMDRVVAIADRCRRAERSKP